MTIGYLEGISKSTAKFDKIAEQVSKISYSKTAHGFELIKTAQNSIFISGVGMQSVHAYRNVLSLIDPRVSITLAVADHDNTDVMIALEHYFNIRPDHWTARRQLFDDGVQRIKIDREVNVINVDIFMPIAYVAVDYYTETEYSFIQAKHYLIAEENTDTKSFFCTVVPGTNLYDYYREQILLIERTNGKLARAMELKND